MNAKGLLPKVLLASVMVLYITAVLLQTPALSVPVIHNAPNHSNQVKARETYGQIPLYFIENHGQVDERVDYYVQGSDNALYFTSQGITFALTDKMAQKTDADAPDYTISQSPLDLGTALGKEAATQRWVVNLDFVGANPNVRPTGHELTSAKVSYFKGAQDQWKTALPTYSKLVYTDLWPGIDLVYAGTVNRLKYEFVVRPGADPNQINLTYRGATAVTINDSGQLQVTTPAGGFTDDVPYAYQEVNHQRVGVSMAYELAADRAPVEGHTLPTTYSFRIGDYDKNQPLVLDPAVLVYAGFIGGSGDDAATSIVVDSFGNSYITGTTTSDDTTFPVSVGPDTTYNGGFDDAFVVKVNAAGTGLIYAGYLGGNGWDEAFGITVDQNGSAYVTGHTISSDFPTTPGAFATTIQGYFDTFVVKLNTTGTALVYSTLLGGVNRDTPKGIALDGSGAAYITGDTMSPDFPTTAGSFSQSYQGGNNGGDVFVVKLNPMGSSLIYSTFLGAGNDEGGIAIAVDGANAAYVTGFTYSLAFPITAGAFQTICTDCSAKHHAFVTKLNTTGSALVYSTFAGGSDHDYGAGIAVDGSGAVYVAGSTSSTDFPTTLGAFATTSHGSQEGFVLKLNSTGSALVYSTYLGGSAQDFASDIALDAAGVAYITGKTESVDFPTTADALQTVCQNCAVNNSDILFVKLNETGSALLYSTYLGGSSNDGSGSIAVDGSGAAYIIGDTRSSDFPTTSGAFGTIHQGGDEAFVVKISSNANNTSVAMDDSYGVNEDTPLTVAAPGVLSNDNDPDGDSLTAVLVSGPSDGTLTLNADGSFIYTPNANFNGADSYTYTAKDTSNALSNEATVDITVNPVNDAPRFNKGVDQTVVEDAGPQTVAGWATGISAGPSDEAGQTLNFLVTNNTKPILFSAGPAIAPNGTLTFTPAPNANGNAEITIVLQDNGGTANGGQDTSPSQTFVITVTPFNDAPVANPDLASVKKNKSVLINVRANDFDPDGDVITVISVSTPAHGLAVINANGTITYTPRNGYTGPDSFTYRIDDGQGGTATATVNVTVTK